MLRGVWEVMINYVVSPELMTALTGGLMLNWAGIFKSSEAAGKVLRNMIRCDAVIHR